MDETEAKNPLKVATFSNRAVLTSSMSAASPDLVPESLCVKKMVHFIQMERYRQYGTAGRGLALL